jgi:PAS domain S-box-containing protein
LIGVRREDRVGLGALDMFGFAPFAEQLTQALVTGQPIFTEIIVAATQKHLAVSIVPMGEHRAAAIFNDVTDAIQAEAALRERETDLRMIMDITPALISYIGSDFRYHRMNQNYARWFNRSMEDIQGRTVQEVLGEAAWERVRPRMERALQGETVSYEEKLPYSSGARYVQASYIPHFDDSGKVRGFVVHVMDMEEHKALEDALREAIERAVWLARFPNENPNPVARISAEGVVLYCNPVAAELPGWKLQIGAPLPENLQPTVRQALLQAQMAAADVELDEKIYSLTAMPFPEDGYVNLYGQDVTARRQVEAALTEYTELLKRSNRSLEEFAFIASHDLQEPLRKISAFGDLLNTRYHDQVDARGQEYIERMQDAARRMQAMIDGLLTYSRVGTRERAFGPVSLYQMAREALADLEVRLRMSQGRVDLGELPIIEADALQMRQLLLNLIGNALKFTRPGVPPLVTVRAVLGDDNWLELSVADNGVGIPAQHTGQLFQPFGRLHGRSQYEGAGLGLAICHKIVERHGGTIRVESIPDEGATFIVRLPCRQDKNLSEK